MNNNDIKDLGYGFILGNSLSVNTVIKNIDHDINWETAWGNDMITPELIKEIKNRGFRTIKVPITWEDHMTYSDDFKSVECEQWWIERCKQVVQYVLDEGLYCVINIHHDADWLFNVSYINEELANLYLEKYKTLWKYIATEFKDFDKNKLFYENLNEVGWESDNYKYNQIFGQAFIDIVRLIDGDSDRLLFIEGVYSDTETTLRDMWDVQDDNYVLALHFYTPNNYTIPEDTLAITLIQQELEGKDPVDENGNLLPKVDMDSEEMKNKKYYIGYDAYGGKVGYAEYDHEITEEFLNKILEVQEKYNCKCAITEFGINPKYRDKDHVYDWIKQVTVFCEYNNIPLMLWNNGNKHQCILRDEGMIDRDHIEMKKIISFYNHIVFGDELPDEYKAEDCI